MVAVLLLLAPALASAQDTGTGKALINGTQFRIDYAVQFEKATLRVSRVGQSDVWTEQFPQGTSIGGDLAVLMGGAASDGFYRYEIEFTWPGNPEPTTVSGGFKIAGGQIQTAEPTQKSAGGPSPQADLFVDGTLRVSGPACIGCPNGTLVITGKLDVYDGGTGISATNYRLNSSSVIWTVGNSSENFAISRGSLGAAPFGIQAGAPDTSLFIRSSGNVGIGTSTPNGELHVLKTSSNTDLYVERLGTNPSAGLLSAQPDLVVFGTISNDPFVIATNNTNRIFIGGGGGVTVTGDFTVTGGTKNFAEDHPTDPTKSIYYAAMEGPEAGTYVRGSAVLVKGQAVIDLPDHFSMVTAEEGLTVQLTPRGEWLQAFVVAVTPHKLVLRERSGKSGRIDYRVEGVRKGYTNFQVIRDRTNLPATATGGSK